MSELCHHLTQIVLQSLRKTESLNPLSLIRVQTLAEAKMYFCVPLRFDFWRT